MKHGDNIHDYEEPYAVGDGYMLLYEPISIAARVASCTSIYSYVFSLSSPGINGAVPLIEILGARGFSGSASYRVFDEKLKLIGEVEQTFEARSMMSQLRLLGRHMLMPYTMIKICVETKV